MAGEDAGPWPSMKLENWRGTGTRVMSTPEKSGGAAGAPTVASDTIEATRWTRTSGDQRRNTADQ